MSGTSTYSDYVCSSANGSEKKRNVVERLHSKYKGQINRLNVKHVLGNLSRAIEGTEVVKFGSRRYRAMIIDILESQPP